jgi:hypothetical protein
MLITNYLITENKTINARIFFFAPFAEGVKLLITPNKFTQFGARRCNTLTLNYIVVQQTIFTNKKLNHVSLPSNTLSHCFSH